VRVSVWCDPATDADTAPVAFVSERGRDKRRAALVTVKVLDRISRFVGDQMRRTLLWAESAR
jgi:hypothetical protein